MPGAQRRLAPISPQSLQSHQRILRGWESAAAANQVKPLTDFPTLVEMKAFLKFWIAASNGRLGPGVETIPGPPPFTAQEKSTSARKRRLRGRARQEAALLPARPPKRVALARSVASSSAPRDAAQDATQDAPQAPRVLYTLSTARAQVYLLLAAIRRQFRRPVPAQTYIAEQLDLYVVQKLAPHFEPKNVVLPKPMGNYLDLLRLLQETLSEAWLKGHHPRDILHQLAYCNFFVDVVARGGDVLATKAGGDCLKWGDFHFRFSAGPRLGAIARIRRLKARMTRKNKTWKGMLIKAYTTVPPILNTGLLIMTMAILDGVFPWTGQSAKDKTYTVSARGSESLAGLADPKRKPAKVISPESVRELAVFRKVRSGRGVTASPLTYSAMRTRFNALARRAGYGRYTPYALRRSVANLVARRRGRGRARAAMGHTMNSRALQEHYLSHLPVLHPQTLFRGLPSRVDPMGLSNVSRVDLGAVARGEGGPTAVKGGEGDAGTATQAGEGTAPQAVSDTAPQAVSDTAPQAGSVVEWLIKVPPADDPDPVRTLNETLNTMLAIFDPKRRRLTRELTLEEAREGGQGRGGGGGRREVKGKARERDDDDDDDEDDDEEDASDDHYSDTSGDSSHVGSEYNSEGCMALEDESEVESDDSEACSDRSTESGGLAEM